MATQPVPRINDKPVKVYKDARVDKDKEKVHINKGKDQVVWEAEEATTIAFDPQRCPFPWTSKDIPAGESRGSGLPNSDADEGEYKYTIYVGSKKNDPTVIVHN